MRAVHYIGFRGDEYSRAYRIFGGPAMIHRVHDLRAHRDIGEDDLVLFWASHGVSRFHLVRYRRRSGPCASGAGGSSSRHN